MPELILTEIESKEIEYKEFLNRHESYMKTVVAFANGHGGKIIFGVRDKDRVVVGISNDDISKITDAIINAISDSCDPAIIPDVILQTIGDKTVIIIDIPKGMQKPYFIKSEGMLKGVYIRVGGTTRHADRYLVQELILRGKNRHYDEQPVEDHSVTEDEVIALCNDMYNFTIETCDEEETGAIKRVTKRQLLSWNLLYETDSKLIPGSGYLLLSGDDETFPQAQIQCAVFKGKTRGIFITKRDFSGPIYRQLQDAYNFVLQNIKIGSKIDGVFRRDFYELPKNSIRELIANAVCHRSYLSPDRIQIALYDDRLEITSPAMLHDELTVEQMKRGLSKPRNRGIASAFVYMGIVEAWGSGIPKVFAEAEAYGLREPELIPSELTFRINLFRKEQIFDVKEMDDSYLDGTNGGTIGTNDITGLNSNEKIVYLLLSQDSKISINKIVAETNISKRTINRIIKSLKENGYITRVGGIRGKWVILK